MKSHAECSGCSLCLLACPVWRQTRDIRLTPHGRAKALQHGASAGDIGPSIDSCTLCGACEPACPEQLPLVDMMLALRRERPLEHSGIFFQDEEQAGNSLLLLPGRALRSDAGRLARIAGMLDAVIAADDGSDVSLALEAGIEVPSERLDAFLKNVGKAGQLVVADGLLLRHLRAWLPRKSMRSLGEALSALDAVRSQLRSSDLYVIEPRAFHQEHARLVGHYDRLRKDRNLQTNLDLQRLAIPTTANALAKGDTAAQARWIMEGREFERVVVEDAADCAVFAAVTDRPVLHLGDL